MRVLQPFIIIAICLAGLFSPTALSAAAGNNLPPTSELSAVDISAAPLVASLSIYDNQPSPASATAHLTMYDAMPCMAIANNHPSLINATPPCPNPFLAYATQALNRTYDPQPSYSQIANGTYAYDGLTISAVAPKNPVNHKYSYADRVRQRALEDPSSHNFPYSLDDEILATKPIPKNNGYTIYQKPGNMAGKVVTDPKTGVKIQTYKEGVFEIGVTKDGVIDHRFFRPNGG